MTKEYPLTGKVYFRESTQEWVLELNGVINDTNFTTRHTQPADTKPEDVVGLPSLYELVDAAYDEMLRRQLHSHPRKFNFAAHMLMRGDNVLDQVHDWMSKAAKRFEAACKVVHAKSFPPPPDVDKRP